MLNQTDTAMMESLNFKFMKDRSPDLAENGANLERICDGPEDDALMLLRKLGEKLLHAFILDRGGQIHLPDRPKDGKTKPFWSLVNEDCADRSKAWHIAEPQRSQFFSELIAEGNKAAHGRQSKVTFSARRLLRVVWEFACWVWTELDWGAVPAKFIEPPKGGVELDKARTESIEATKLIAELKRKSAEDEKRAAEAERREAAALGPANLTHWIRPEQKAFSLPPNFAGREFAFDTIKEFLTHSEQRVLLIEGQPGRGKTAIIQQFLKRGDFAGFDPLAYFFDYQVSKAESKQWVQHLYAALLAQRHIKESDRSILHADQDDLSQRLRQRLWELATSQPDQRILIVIDAVDEDGSAEPTVKSFLLDDLPKTVKVIATTRPGHVRHSSYGRGSESEHVRPFNLEDPDWHQKHREDAQQYADSVLKELAGDAAKEVARLSDGNFLILRLVCQELRSIPESQIAGSLRELKRLKNAGKDLRAALFERAWLRLQESLDRDSLNSVYSVAGLLAIARRLTESMIRSMVSLSKADWDKLRLQFIEYLTEIPQGADESEAGDGEAEPVYRLFHETFEVFVQQQLRKDMENIKKQVAAYCVKQIKEGNDTYECNYALRFTVQHLVEARLDEELVNVLTDLDFIEARFTAGQGFDLLADYELAVRSHPDTSDEFLRRDEQNQKLRKWVEELVDYSRKCTRIREEYARDEFANPHDKIRKLSPPKLEALRTNNPRRPSNGGVSSPLLEFQHFVATEFELLTEVSDSTLEIARNYSSNGCVAEAANRLCAQREKTVALRRIVPRRHGWEDSLVVNRIDHAVGDAVGMSWGGMTPDAQIGFANCSDGCWEDRIWDLRTGRQLLSGIPMMVLAITPDGHRAVVHISHSDVVQIIDLKEEKIIHQIALGDSFECLLSGHVTPDGSLAVFLDRGWDEQVRCQAALLIWNTRDNQTKRIPLGDISPNDVFLSMSGLLVAVLGHRDDELVWEYCDLTDLNVIASAPYESGDAVLSDYGPCVRHDLATSIRAKTGSLTEVGDLVAGNALVSLGRNPLELRLRDDVLRTLFDGRFPWTTLEGITADRRLGVASSDTSYFLLDLTKVVTSDAAIDSTRNAPLTDSPEANRGSQRSPATSVLRCGLEELDLANELEFVVKIASGTTTLNAVGSTEDANILTSKLPLEANFPLSPSDRKLLGTAPDVLISADGRYLVSLHRHSQLGSCHELLGKPEPEIEPVTVTDLKTGEHFGIPDQRNLLTVTRDGTAIVFESDRSFGRRIDHVTIWNFHLKKCAHEILGQHVVCDRGSFPFIPTNGVQSPDGRVLVLQDYSTCILAHLNSNDRVELSERRWRRHDIDSICFSPDGRYLFFRQGNAAYLWEVSSGNCRGVLELEDLHWPDVVWIDCDGDLRAEQGHSVGIKIDDPHRKPPWVTGVRLWRYRPNEEQKVVLIAHNFWQPSSMMMKGAYDEEITFRCRYCGERKELPRSVIETIDRIRRDEELDDSDSPVLKLPDRAWDSDSNNGLNFDCPNERCRKPHRSTPFYVDRKRSDLQDAPRS